MTPIADRHVDEENIALACTCTAFGTDPDQPWQARRPTDSAGEHPLPFRAERIHTYDADAWRMRFGHLHVFETWRNHLET